MHLSMHCSRCHMHRTDCCAKGRVCPAHTQLTNWKCLQCCLPSKAYAWGSHPLHCKNKYLKKNTCKYLSPMLLRDLCNLSNTCRSLSNACTGLEPPGGTLVYRQHIPANCKRRYNLESSLSQAEGSTQLCEEYCKPSKGLIKAYKAFEHWQILSLNGSKWPKIRDANSMLQGKAWKHTVLSSS